MKIALKCSSGMLIGLLAAIRVHGQGYIVSNGVTYSGFNGVGYQINVLHNPNNPTDNYTGFSLDADGKTPPTSPVVNTFEFDPIVDVGVRVFFVQPNDPISLQPILSMNYAELTYPNSYVFQNNQPVYLGLYTGNQSFAPPNGIYSDPLFGWAEVENVNGTIELLNSALEYQGGGIYAGTQNIIPVPESRTWALLFFGAGLIGIARYANSRLKA